MFLYLNVYVYLNIYIYIVCMFGSLYFVLLYFAHIARIGRIRIDRKRPAPRCIMYDIME